MLKPLIVTLILTSIHACTLLAQDFLEINTKHRCLYQGTNMPEELYRFEPSDSIEALKDEILQRTGYAQNFEFVCSNVPSVVAVVDKDKRYVLYSRKFFSHQTDQVVRLAMLAHEIGHHVNEHKLAGGEPNPAEEMEADEFMGYVLHLSAVSEETIDGIASNYPLASGIDSLDRRQDIQRGARKARLSMENAGHVGWDENDIKEVYKNFPKFSLPAPRPSAEASVDQCFRSCRTLNDADQKLRKALNMAGYNTRRYYCIPDGFALVTQLEQINADGSSKNETNRWTSKIVRCEDFSVSCYLSALLSSEPGYFRTFVFLVTPHTLTTSGRPATQDDMGLWLEEGANKLPPALAKLPFDNNTNVTVLIYEFKVRESDRKPILSTPSALNGQVHLRKSKIFNFLCN